MGGSSIPGLVVNILDTQSEPWSSDVGIDPRVHLNNLDELEGPLDGGKTKRQPDSRQYVTTKKYLKNKNI